MERVRLDFERQGALRLLGATLERVEPGAVEIAVRYRAEVAQHHGFFHGGVVATLLDVACGFAALTRMEADQEVLTAEFKVNFLAPAQGSMLVARGRVVKAGRLLSVCSGEAFCRGEEGERQVALMQATMAAVRSRA